MSLARTMDSQEPQMTACPLREVTRKIPSEASRTAGNIAEGPGMREEN
jgi:hypothetical protein